ncbi:MAG: DUF192 domain-containing protein [Candidatus Micrarchaeota archaeon]
MRVVNKTKGSLLTDNPIIADSFFSRLRGLMFRLRFPRPLLFVFPNTSPKRNAIHSFFVFFPFDAVYLDGEKMVVDIYERVRPFTHYIEPKCPVKYLLELEGGSVKKLGIEVEDRLEF